MVVFELSNSNHLGFRVEDGEILLLNLSLEDHNGNPNDEIERLSGESLGERLDGYCSSGSSALRAS